VQGLAHALSYSGNVTSPTFTLSNIYKLPSGLEIHHYDLYRLGVSGVVGEELAEDLTDPRVINIVEWAGIVSDELPADRLRIEIIVTGDTERTFTVASSGPVSERLLIGIKS
jgi:tRNA threonylcarbamoyladenosine biosynthesis protein TsaE